jgi:hypothetical protein
MHNQRDMTALALSAGAAIQVADAADLAGQVLRLLTDAPAAAALRAGADRLLGENRGAAARCAEVILGLLGVQGTTGVQAFGRSGVQEETGGPSAVRDTSPPDAPNARTPERLNA